MDYIKTKRWLNCKGIDFERCALDIYEQNGIAETVKKTIIIKVRVIRFLRRFFHMFWREIIRVAVYLYNRTLRQSLDWKTLYKVFQEHVMSV